MNLLKMFQALVGNKNDREVKKIKATVEKINLLEPTYQKLADKDFPIEIQKLKERHAKGETLDKLLPETYALVREASIRSTGMRHYDVQMVGGIALHQGKICEMKTGEGKTLVATLPCCLNALSGKGVHLVTVNDYLASRDAEWMGKVYNFLGLTVGVITNNLSDSERLKNYACDITYGTNNEFGFDYLRDNMKSDLNRVVQRELNFAIIDEVDSILIDEARTPLIISGPSSESTELYHVIDSVVPKLQKGVDFTVDEKDRNVFLTDTGVTKVEHLLGKLKVLQVEGLYSPENILLLHHITQALRAHTLYKVDRDYMIQGGEVMIIDEHTGRALAGRRWSDGLHQAVEAKEKVRIEGENETLATISFQNYFRLYNKISGMTGTAETEAAEFFNTYKREVLVIPTNKPIQRKDYNDIVYRTEREKFEKVIEHISEAQERGNPVLVGTASIEKSEILHRMLKKKDIVHFVLNAKHQQKEAQLVAQAGRLGAVTIATNMAGRGTDIILGGNPEPFIEEILVQYGANPKSIESTIFIKEALKGDEKRARELGKKLANLKEEDFNKIFKHRDEWIIEAQKVKECGGLVIIATERHDSRRIDNQLRGRSGRQGDPGESRFYLSLEDDLMLRFGSDRLGSILDTLGMEYGEPIEHGLVTKGIENAQKKVETYNSEIRKNMLEYDDVMNVQRKTIYSWRNKILRMEGVREEFHLMAEDIIVGLVERYCSAQVHIEEWDLDLIESKVKEAFRLDLEIDEKVLLGAYDAMDTLKHMLWDAVEAQYIKKEKKLIADFTEQIAREVEQELMLQSIDDHWKEHLKNIDHLREGIGLQGYRQVDPKLIYKKEAFEMFKSLLTLIRYHTVQNYFHMEIRDASEFEQSVQRRREEEHEMFFQHDDPDSENGHGGNDIDEPAKQEPVRRESPKVGRNDPCHCGSGKKYKKCHMNQDQARS